jgi:hypothetical protein
MKIFENAGSSYSSKVNFVDENDVFVGYDTQQGCCEDAGYFLSYKITGDIYGDDSDVNVPSEELNHYCFKKAEPTWVDSKDVESGGVVAFLLEAPDRPNLYLHLYNNHNGYYSHGFQIVAGEEVIEEGYL